MCVLLILDQSYSTNETLAGSSKRKCDEISAAVNRCIDNLAVRVSDESGVRDFVDIGAIGYRTDVKGNPVIDAALPGTAVDDPLVSIVRLVADPKRMDTARVKMEIGAEGKSQLVETVVPVWVEQFVEGHAPLCHVLKHARGVVEKWVEANPDGFAPIVIHVTGSESRDGDPTEDAAAISNLSTNDGGVLFFNCHVASGETEPILFPSGEADLPDELARQLFAMSSRLPAPFFERLSGDGYPLGDGARGLTYAADRTTLFVFLSAVTTARIELRLWKTGD